MQFYAQHYGVKIGRVAKGQVRALGASPRRRKQGFLGVQQLSGAGQHCAAHSHTGREQAATLVAAAVSCAAVSWDADGRRATGGV